MPTPIETYIAQCPEEHRARLMEVRALILDAAPGLIEKISWGMPTFYQKRNVIHFALHQHHLGIYPGARAMEVFAPRLKGYKTSKGALQLPHTKPLPRDLLSDLTRFCAEEAK